MLPVHLFLDEISSNFRGFINSDFKSSDEFGGQIRIIEMLV